MQPIYIYPGTFCPPTYGHFQIVKRMSKLLPKLHITCGVNPKKNESWFTPEQCVELWKAYDLPENVTVSTLGNLPKDFLEFNNMILVLGIRNNDDYQYMSEVIKLNREKFGIDKYLLVHSECKFENVSSTRARSLAEKLDLYELGKIVAPLVVTALLKKVLDLEDIYIVVGKPASGKTTVMKALESKKENVTYVNTDDSVARDLKEIIKNHFEGKDMLNVLIENEDELLKVIYKPWLELLSVRLRNVRKGTTLFIEVATALQANKKVYRYVGGKIVYLGCGDDNNHKRIDGRNTQIHHQLVERIPNLEQSAWIAKKDKLEFYHFDTRQKVHEVVLEISKKLNLDERRNSL